MQQPSAGNQSRSRPPSAPARKILVVDDNREAVEMLKMLLDTTGNQLITPMTGSKQSSSRRKSGRI